MRMLRHRGVWKVTWPADGRKADSYSACNFPTILTQAPSESPGGFCWFFFLRKTKYRFLNLRFVLISYRFLRVYPSKGKALPPPHPPYF
jgi:hypothetical protein